ncbi:hypothetical protein GCM10009628_40720 [Paeniglutamicibacter kerguelensis]
MDRTPKVAIPAMVAAMLRPVAQKMLSLAMLLSAALAAGPTSAVKPVLDRLASVRTARSCLTENTTWNRNQSVAAIVPAHQIGALAYPSKVCGMAA